MSKDKRKNKSALEKACDEIITANNRRPKGAKGHKTINKERKQKLWDSGLRPWMSA